MEKEILKMKNISGLFYSKIKLFKLNLVAAGLPPFIVDGNTNNKAYLAFLPLIMLSFVFRLLCCIPKVRKDDLIDNYFIK